MISANEANRDGRYDIDSLNFDDYLREILASTDLSVIRNKIPEKYLSKIVKGTAKTKFSLTKLNIAEKQYILSLLGYQTATIVFKEGGVNGEQLGAVLQNFNKGVKELEHLHTLKNMGVFVIGDNSLMSVFSHLDTVFASQRYGVVKDWHLLNQKIVRRNPDEEEKVQLLKYIKVLNEVYLSNVDYVDSLHRSIDINGQIGIYVLCYLKRAVTMHKMDAYEIIAQKKTYSVKHIKNTVKKLIANGYIVELSQPANRSDRVRIQLSAKGTELLHKMYSAACKRAIDQ